MGGISDRKRLGKETVQSEGGVDCVRCTYIEKSAPKKFPSFEERAEETRDENSDKDREIVGRFPLYGNFRKCR